MDEIGQHAHGRDEGKDLAYSGEGKEDASDHDGDIRRR